MAAQDGANDCLILGRKAKFAMLLQRRPKVIKSDEIDWVQRPGIACNGEQSPTQVDDIGLRPFLFPVSVDDLLYEFGIEQSR